MSIHTHPQARQLLAGLEALSLSLSENQVEQLLTYLDLLGKWNRAFNLTAVRDPAAMVSRHLLDSLAVLPHLRGERWVDVGTGAGLPGLVMAIARPDWTLTLLDSNGKKTRFLFQVKSTLGLPNVSIVHQRVEAWQPPRPVTGVISRAFSDLATMADLCKHLLSTEPDDHARLYAMKGALTEAELSALGKPFKVEHRLSLTVPDLAEQRHLVVIAAAA